MTSRFRDFVSFAQIKNKSFLVLFGCGFFSQSARASNFLPAQHLILSHTNQISQIKAEPYAKPIRLDHRLSNNFSEELLSIQNSDKSEAKRLLPFDADVHLVKKQAQSRDLQVIGTNKEDVWAFDVASQVAKVKKIGKIFSPDNKTLSRIERSVSGSKIILAFEIISDNLPSENPWTDLVSTSQIYAAFVQAQNSLYKVSFNAEDTLIVQRLGTLKN